MAGVDRIRITKSGWHSYPQHGRHSGKKMKQPVDKDAQTHTGQSEHNDNRDEDQIHIDEYV